MHKLEDITVLHIDIGEALNPAVEREIDTADIVIDGGEVVKNRVNQVETPGVSANNAIDQAEKIITEIFENGEHDKQTGESLYRVMTLLADARETINTDAGDNADICDSVSAAMLNINKICIIGSRYSDAIFSDDDGDDENCLIFRTLIDFATEARRRLKVAESELFK
ncbi:hypothetical protein ACK861_004868 [Salmonella enterica]